MESKRNLIACLKNHSVNHFYVMQIVTGFMQIYTACYTTKDQKIFAFNLICIEWYRKLNLCGIINIESNHYQ